MVKEQQMQYKEDSVIFKIYKSKLGSKIVSSHFYFLRKELRHNYRVLDLGCGSRSALQFCNVLYSIGVDLFEPELYESKKRKYTTHTL